MEHKRARHKQQFVCDYCSNKYATKHMLVKHLASHSGAKPYVCGVSDLGSSPTCKAWATNTLWSHVVYVFSSLACRTPDLTPDPRPQTPNPDLT